MRFEIKKVRPFYGRLFFDVVRDGGMGVILERPSQQALDLNPF